MSSNVINNLQSKNASYSSSYEHAGLASPPAKKYVIVTCMDARLDPAAAYGIQLGDAHIIRNAGGNARDALRSIIISNHVLGTQEVLVIKHTKCGMIGATNEGIRGLVEKNLGGERKRDLEGFDFQAFDDVETAIKDDVRFLKGNDLLPQHVTVSGWIHDVESGEAKLVQA